MSEHYTVIISIILDPARAARHAAVLNYVFNAVDAAPDSYPDHGYFHSVVPQDRFHISYAQMPPGSWQSVFWTVQGDAGLEQAGVNLTLPGNKLEGLMQDILPLASWLASLAVGDGCMGMAMAETGGPRDEPMVLFCRCGKLYIGKASLEDACSFDGDS